MTIKKALTPTVRAFMRFGLCGYGAHRPCEIARALGISPKMAQSRMRYALARLREHTELLDLAGGQGAVSLCQFEEWNEQREKPCMVLRQKESRFGERQKEEYTREENGQRDKPS